MEDYVTLKAFLGIEGIFDYDDAESMMNFMCTFLDSVEDKKINGYFDIVREYKKRTSYIYAITKLPKWSETILITKYPDYDWKQIESTF